MKDDKNGKKELFSKYLNDTKILIADPSSASRVRLANTFVKMGAKASLITMHGNYASAQDYLKHERPKVVLSEYYLGTKSGFDLMVDFKKMYQVDKDSLSILVTANSSQSTVARAAEEDVDSFVIKPYTLESLESCITKAAIDKLYPSEYMRKINEGKDLMVQGNLSRAKEVMREAVRLEGKPALAFFYHGQIEQMERALDNASADFNKGLSFNGIHFKCLVSLFDVLTSQRKHEEAYDIVKKIANYFPANPKRLASVIRLAIMTNNYEDIEKYYQIFTTLDERTDELTRYICSGLIVTGKWYLKNKHRNRALDLFEKAGVSSASQAQFLQFIVENLVEAKMVPDAEKYIQRFRADEFEKPFYQISKFLVDGSKADPLMTIYQGQTLLKKGIHHQGCYKTMLEKLHEVGKKEEYDELKTVFVTKWPEKKDDITLMEERFESEKEGLAA